MLGEMTMTVNIAVTAYVRLGLDFSEGWNKTQYLKNKRWRIKMYETHLIVYFKDSPFHTQFS